jgi:hypothetical protein
MTHGRPSAGHGAAFQQAAREWLPPGESPRTTRHDGPSWRRGETGTAAQLKVDAWRVVATNSGSNPAGFDDQWRDFDRQWAAVLRQPFPHRGPISHIHGKELRQGTKQFKGWPLHERQQLAMAASGLAQRYSDFSISVLLENSDYDRIYIGADRALRKHRDAIDSKYGVCFRVFLSLVTRILDRHYPSETVKIVVEAGHSNGGAAEEIFSGMEKIAPDLARFVSAITYVRKRESAGVQAADMLAYPVFVLERDGEPEFSDIDLTVGEPLPKIEKANYRVPVRPETLVDIKTGQIAIATGRIIA